MECQSLHWNILCSAVAGKSSCQEEAVMFSCCYIQRKVVQTFSWLVFMRILREYHLKNWTLIEGAQNLHAQTWKNVQKIRTHYHLVTRIYFIFSQLILPSYDPARFMQDAGGVHCTGMYGVHICFSKVPFKVRTKHHRKKYSFFGDYGLYVFFVIFHWFYYPYAITKSTYYPHHGIEISCEYYTSTYIWKRSQELIDCCKGLKICHTQTVWVDRYYLFLKTVFLRS